MPNRKFLSISVLAFFLSVSLLAEAGFDEGMKANQKGDRETAFTEFQAAALDGDVRAYGKLGSMYLYGLGTEKDYSMAYVWFGLSDETGDKYGKRFQDTAASVMTGEQVRQSEKLLAEYREKLGLDTPSDNR